VNPKPVSEGLVDRWVPFMCVCFSVGFEFGWRTRYVFQCPRYPNVALLWSTRTPRLAVHDRHL